MSLALSSNLATASVAARRSTVRPTRAAVSIAPAAPLRFAGARRVGMTRVARRHTSTLRVQASASGVERQSFETRPAVEDAIQKAIGNCLVETDLGIGKKTQGKVRDFYDLGDLLVLITTDRQSAFDRLLATVPFKGQVLNQTSTWWFQNTTHICKNALVATPDPNVAIMRKLEVIPVEFIMRGYLTGSTETSIWTHYKNGSRNYCGNPLADGMVKNQPLPENIITPTTKGVRDVPIDAEGIVAEGLMSQAEWDAVSQAAKELFAFGQAEAAKRGLILVDTKYEFGRDGLGNFYLIDEVHTPDSSRYWVKGSFDERFAAGMEPENIDKEFLRLWFRDNCDPYKDETLPEAPAELVSELSRRYIRLYETITGTEFVPGVSSFFESPAERIRKNVTNALDQLRSN